MDPCVKCKCKTCPGVIKNSGYYLPVKNSGVGIGSGDVYRRGFNSIYNALFCKKESLKLRVTRF